MAANRFHGYRNQGMCSASRMSSLRQPHSKRVHRASPSKARGRKSNALGPLVVRKRAVAFCMTVPSASDPK